MKKGIFLLVFIGFLYLSPAANGQDAAKGDDATPARDSLSNDDSQMAAKIKANTKYVPVEKYDPLRNADQDIQAALAEATRTNRRVLLEVGGLWCVWCRHLDAFFEKQRDVLAIREKHFVMLKINYSDENKNAAVLSRYPRIAGFPHFFVLDTEGKLLHSQDTAVLEEGKGYSTSKVSEFLTKWADALPEQVNK